MNRRLRKRCPGYVACYECKSLTPRRTRSFLELASNALGDERHISPAVAILRRHLAQLVAGGEHARGPASPAQVGVGILVEDVELLADGLQAAGVAGSAAGLGQDGLALVGAQPLAEVGEVADVVRRAGRVCAGVVGVEVAVHVEDQVRRAAVEVGHFHEGRAGAVGDEGAGGRVVVAGQEDLVACRAGLADRGHGGLNSGGPSVDVDIVLDGLSV